MKKLKLYLFAGTGIVFVFIISILFFVNIGVNNDFFIKKDFNQAFQFRLTGDCDAFLEYVFVEHDKWKERCEKEKSNKNKPIVNFRIMRISHNYFSNKAFLQVELTRKNNTYTVNYDIIKDGFIWKINQELNIQP